MLGDLRALFFLLGGVRREVELLQALPSAPRQEQVQDGVNETPT